MSSSHRSQASRLAKPASAFTLAAQQAVLRSMPVGDRQSFDDAARGFIATLEGPIKIKRGEKQGGKVVYDIAGLEEMLKKPQAPDTINPSLWRNAQLNTLYHGLYEVVARKIYQVRAFDMANMTLIAGADGWIVIDPLTSSETSKAALDLANKHLGFRKVSAVIITHSHADHFMGILGVVNAEEVAAGKVAIVAPKDFAKEAISENVLLGTVMRRRADLMYGSLLEVDERGYVGSGLAARLSKGTTSLLPPTDTITKTGERRTLDGVEFVFEMTMGSEAPSEFIFFLPEFKALCMSEIATHHLHNVYTVRGAQIRDCLAWSEQIQQSIDMFCNEGQVEVEFASHHWPTWGRENIVQFLSDQVDLYRFIHDQTLRLANHGYNKEEIAEQIVLPRALAEKFYNREYYGTVHHNVRAVYVKYLGYLDGNPANLHPLHPVTEAEKYVEFMGGAAEVLRKARACHEKGEYRWVAEVVNKVVQADPGNEDACALLADSFEQMGYQAESGPWRNFYLTGAQELRHGVQQPKQTPGVVAGVALHMPMESVFQALSVQLDGIAAAASGLNLKMNFKFLDTNEWALMLRNGVLHSFKDRQDPDAAVTLTARSIDVKTLIASRSAAKMKESIKDGKILIDGDPNALVRLFEVLDRFNPYFPIVTPRPRL